MNNNRLWYKKPASEWKEGLPIGTGRLAAMIIGNPDTERIALNHEWLSSGYHRNRVNEDRSAYLEKVRALLEKEDYAQASKLANEAWGGNGGISGKPTNEDAYKPLGDFYFSIDHKEVSEYRRELNLDTDEVIVSYKSDGNNYICRYMAQLVRDCIIVDISATGEQFDISMWFDRIKEDGVSIVRKCSGNELTMEGEFTGGGLKFAAIAGVKTTGGEIKEEDGKLKAVNASRVTIFINMGTDIKPGITPLDECRKNLDITVPYDKLFEENVVEYESHYGRLKLSIDIQENEYEKMPTDERILCYRNQSSEKENPAVKAGLIDATDNIDTSEKEKYKLGYDDSTMPLLYFNYGRYLLCSSSANGELPANLQGKWNEEIYPAWDCDYHNDINIQMNYWPAESGHLQEYMGAFFTYLKKMVPFGKDAAKKLFGCNGIWLPLSSDAWGCATPETYGWSVWCSVAAWFGQHIWWHYEYSQDKDFLKNEGYPYLKEVAAFYEDFLVKDKDGVYQIMPSQSPENHFEGGGEMPVTICVSSAVDVEFAMELLTHTIKAAKILDTDNDKIAVWQELLDNLPKLKIGSKGQLLEWNKEFVETEPFHRHISHLIGLYPGEMIHPDKTPELYEAAAKSLKLRIDAGGGYTGWSRAWVSCVYARMGKGDEAWENLRALIGDYATESLLDLHPPRIFQIDGNLGGTAAILEMLLQSYYEELDILPALPTIWKKGKVTGIRARGGYTLDIEWDNNKLQKATIVSCTDRICKVKMKNHKYKVSDNNGETVVTECKDNICSFDVVKNIEYTLIYDN